MCSPNFIYSFKILVAILVLASCSDNSLAPKDAAIFDDNVIHEIRIESYSNNLYADLVKDRISKKKGKNLGFQACKVSIDGTLLDSIGIRFKGESSYDFQKNKKKSFKLSFNEFRKKQRYQKLKALLLNNEFKDPTFIREKLLLDLKISEGLPAQRNAYCKVYFNGELLGLYLLLENLDNSFLKRTFGNSKGQLYNGKPKARLQPVPDSVTNLHTAYSRKNKKKSEDWSDLIGFIGSIHSPLKGEAYKAQLDSGFSTEPCLKLFAINNLFMNVDAYNLLYAHNFMLYCDPKAKKTHWIGYDYNYGFACWSPTLTYDEVVNFSIFHQQEPADHFEFVDKLLINDIENRKFYKQYLQELIDKKITSGWMENRIYNYYELIREAVKEDKLKLTSTADFEQNIETTLGDKKDPGAFIPGLMELMNDRVISVEKQLESGK